MKKIVVLSGSTGGGHVSAANSLHLYSEKLHKNVHFIHIDVIKYMTLFFEKVYAGTYINMIKYYPSLFGYLYKLTDSQHRPQNGKINRDAILKELRYQLEEFFSKRFKRAIRKIKPDYIVFTHFLPEEHFNKIAQKKHKKYAKKYAVVVTDFDVHTVWMHKGMDLFFVASEEGKMRLIKNGIDPEKIHITGIPIKPCFSEKFDKEKIREELGLSPNLETVLLMTGAHGVGRVDTFTKNLFDNIDKNFQVIALTGTNKKLKKSLDKLGKKYPGRIKAVGFTDEVAKYMAACDFAVTKTGGLTTSECIAMGLPIVTIKPIPGMEERNTDYLLENGAAFKALDITGLIYRVNKLLTDKKLLTQMQQNALKIATPKAGEKILDIILKSDDS